MLLYEQQEHSDLMLVNEIISKYLLSGVPYVGPSSVCLHIFVVELYSFSLNLNENKNTPSKLAK